MNRFYQTIIIVSLFVLILYIIYFIKALLVKHRREKAIQWLREKDYIDNREYNRSYISALIDKLREEQILWLEIHSSRHPGNRISLNRLAGSERMSLKFEEIRPDKNIEPDIRKLGAEAVFLRNRRLSQLIVPFNPRIVTDAVYFLFEEVFSHERVYMLKYKY